MTLTRIDGDALRRIRTSVTQRLLGLGSDYGVTFDLTNGKYNNGASGHLKMEITLNAPDGTRRNADQLAFEEHLERHRVPMDALGKQFTSRGHSYTLTGYAPRGRKFNFLARRASNRKIYKFTGKFIRSKFPADNPTPEDGIPTPVLVNGDLLQ